jgi:Pyruvate/2-oxoacid:ferredoxin oxidoreductase delta subunit
MDLTVKVAGVKLKNPVIATSGPLGRTFMSLKKSIEGGAGAVTLRSCSSFPAGWPKHMPGWYIQPRPAHMFLRKYGVSYLMHNWEGCPPETFTAEMEAELIHKIKPIADDHDCRIIGSVNVGTEYMKDKELYKKDVRTVLQAKPDLMEHSPACWMHIWPRPPWPAKERQDRMDEMHFLEKEECQKVKIPTIAKGISLTIGESLAPYKKRIRDFEKRGITTIHCGSGFQNYGTFVDIETMKPVVPGPEAPVHGTFMRPGANLVAALTKAEGSEVISSGGVWTVHDCIERMMCGATAVGLHTAVMYHGQQLFGKLIKGISEYLEREGLKLEQIIGVAVPKAVSWDARHEFMAQHELPNEALRVEIDLSMCKACGLCANCFNGALTMQDDTPTWNRKLCERCGICESLCPTDAITLRRV